MNGNSYKYIIDVVAIIVLLIFLPSTCAYYNIQVSRHSAKIGEKCIEAKKEWRGYSDGSGICRNKLDESD